METELHRVGCFEDERTRPMTRSRLSILAFIMMLGGSAALADNLNLGSNYPTFVVDVSGSPTWTTGGPISPSTLNGKALAFVYCVDVYDTVLVPADYPNTIVTNNGVVNGATVNNAGKIAWLLDTYGVSAVNLNAEEALQAAIWNVEYGFITGDPFQSYYTDYTSDLAALGSNTAAVSSLYWFTPGGNASCVEGWNCVQGLVSPDAPPPAVPEPTSVVLFGTVLLFAARSMKRKLGAAR